MYIYTISKIVKRKFELLLTLTRIKFQLTKLHEKKKDKRKNIELINNERDKTKRKLSLFDSET